MTPADARRSLVVYFAFLIPLSVLGYWAWIARGQHMLLPFVPVLAALAARIVRRETLFDAAGRRVGWRWWPAALLVPLGVCAATYGLAWAAGWAGFHPARLPRPFPTLTDPYLHFAWTILLSLTVVTAFFAPLAAGEELGWRGHMLPRMVAAGVPAPLFASGLIWGAWHVPLILAGGYQPGGGPPLAASAVFLVSATAYGWFLGYLRLSSASVWPAVVAHAAWNALTQACFNPAVGPHLWPWLGESGVLVAAALVAVAALLAARNRPLR